MSDHKITDAAPFIRALSFAFYAMHDQLVEAGALEQGQVANALRRFDPGADVESQQTAAIMAAMADMLERMMFGDGGTPRTFGVIDGGKPDND